MTITRSTPAVKSVNCGIAFIQSSQQNQRCNYCHQATKLGGCDCRDVHCKIVSARSLAAICVCQLRLPAAVRTYVLQKQQM